MIQASEIRIGNWLDLKNSGFIQVDADNIADIVNNPAIFNPVHLSPEIVERCGFENNRNTIFSKGRFRIYQSQGSGNGFTFNWHKDHDQLGITATLFKHLHELQNLHFALTGEELPVNL